MKEFSLGRLPPLFGHTVRIEMPLVAMLVSPHARFTRLDNAIAKLGATNASKVLNATSAWARHDRNTEIHNIGRPLVTGKEDSLVLQQLHL
jgi:hypothetical protein